LQVDREELGAIFKNASLLIRALLANVVLVPAFAVLLVRVFHLKDPIAIGLLLMAICPGVPFVVLGGGVKKGGSLGFAVALAFILPAVSVLTVPLTARLLLSGETAVATENIVISLVLFQLLPLLVGMLVKARLPAIAARLVKPVGLVCVAVILVVLVALAKIWFTSVTAVYGSLGILAMLTLVILSLLTGWILGGPDRSHRRTLGVGTALRNPGLAALIATTNFSGIAEAAVMTYLLVQFVAVMIFGITYKPAAGDPQS
ncbi:MAG: bile acid:sodium symporter, partial [Candidatus Cybelea sp.]